MLSEFRYVEMLEQQQEKLVNAIRELYARAVTSGSWTGPPLQATPKGYPLTHDILERLGMLRLGSHDEIAPFEEDTEILRQKMMMTIKQEENPYPTPITTQSEFSPVDSPSYELSSRAFADAMPRTPFQLTPPISPPDEESMSFAGNCLGIDTSVGMESSTIQACQQAWIQSANRYVRKIFLFWYFPIVHLVIRVRGSVLAAKLGD